MAFALRCCPVAATVSRPRSLCVARAHAHEEAPVPANVHEARAWIAAWKQRRMQIEVSEHVTAAGHAKEAHRPMNNVVAAPATAPKPSIWGKAAADGTILFTAGDLKNKEATAEALKTVGVAAAGKAAGTTVVHEKKTTSRKATKKQ